MRQSARHFGNPGTPDFRVDHYPFFLLNRTVSRYTAIIEPRLRQIGLEIPAWRVLMILGERQPRGIAEISEAAVINISTMTRIVQRMTQADLVAIEPHRSDNRVTNVMLTPLGEARLAETRALTAPIYEAIIKGLSEADFRKFLQIMDHLYGNLSALK